MNVSLVRQAGPEQTAYENTNSSSPVDRVWVRVCQTGPLDLKLLPETKVGSNRRS